MELWSCLHLEFP